jgi:hypothetical protein
MIDDTATDILDEKTTRPAPESGPRIKTLAAVAGERDDEREPDLVVEVDHFSDSCFFAPLTGDVDDGGLFVCTWRTLSVGDELTLSIVLPAGEARARGIVVFRRDPTEVAAPGYGVALELRGEVSAERVRDFCREREPLLYEV